MEERGLGGAPPGQGLGAGPLLTLGRDQGAQRDTEAQAGKGNKDPG